MIHNLTFGHLDPAALRERRAVAIRPLDLETIACAIAGLPGLKVEQRDGYVVAPWHGCEDAERGEAFAARIQAETGCLVADRRNGRIVELGQIASRAGADSHEGGWIHPASNSRGDARRRSRVAR